MIVAIPAWSGRVSPVFDTASRLLVADIDAGGEVDRRLIDLGNGSAHERVKRLTSAGIDVLLCGALSRPLFDMLEAAGLQVVPFLSGSVDDYMAIDVSRNTFSGDKGGSIEITCTDADAGGTSSADDVARLSVCDNRMSGYSSTSNDLGHGIYINLAAVDRLQDSVIEGNIINGESLPEGTAAYIDNGIWLYGDDMVSSGFYDLSISRNKVSNVEGIGIYFEVNDVNQPASPD